MDKKRFRAAWIAVHLAILSQVESDKVPYVAKTRKLAKDYGADITTPEDIDSVLNCIDFTKMELS